MTYTYLKLFSFATLLLFSGSCTDSTTGPDEEEAELEPRMAADIPADPADEEEAITYYSLREQAVAAPEDSATAQWDIAFSATTIYTNSGTSGPGAGGAVVLDQSFDATVVAPSEGYATDTEEGLAIPTGSGNGWYIYNMNSEPQHAVLPIEDRTIVIRTADGEHFAKMEILSYYEGNPDTSSEEFINSETRPPSGYYTFRYVIQTDGSRDLQQDFTDSF